MAGVNFYRFNAKNWHFRQILREKLAFFGVNFILQNFARVKKNDKYEVWAHHVLSLLILSFIREKHILDWFYLSELHLFSKQTKYCMNNHFFPRKKNLPISKWFNNTYLSTWALFLVNQEQLPVASSLNHDEFGTKYGCVLSV